MRAIPELGVNFSHRHAAWLGYDPDALYRRLLDDLGVRRLRLSVYWDEISAAPDRLDFAPVRRWLDPLQERGGSALVTLGLKAQRASASPGLPGRRPGYYPPAWLTDANPLPAGAAIEEQQRVVAHLLLMLERLTAFLADYDAVDSWQVEDEPFLPSMQHTPAWRISPALLAREIDVVREADPRRRPIVVNHRSRSRFDRRWWTALLLADVLAEDVYTRRPLRWPWPRYLNVYALWPYAPTLSRYATVARRLSKEFWITELQAEPWEHADMRSLTPAMIGSVSPQRMAANLRRVSRAGARRVYLCGAEWWRHTADHHGDARYWELGRRLFERAREAQ